MTDEKNTSRTRSKQGKGAGLDAERARIVSMASKVRLPYEPSSFTVEQLREVLATIKK